ncbi:MAG: hypothetical protein JWR83_3184 [Aeromicrobium sp.]|nr:hypothetical protein [Aeromicrobium sp.]
MSLDIFEQSLLTELRQHVAAENTSRAPSRRRWTIGVTAGGLAAAGAAAVALSLGTGLVGSSAAYAVEAQPDGDLVVTVHELSDAAGLEQALAAKGVHADVTYVPGFQQVGGQSRTTPDRNASCYIRLAKVDGALRFTLRAAQIAAGSTLDIITSGSSPTDVGSPVSVAWTGAGC